MHRVGLSFVMFILVSLLVGTGWALYQFLPDSAEPPEQAAAKPETSKPHARFNKAATAARDVDETAAKKTDPDSSDPSKTSPIDVALIEPDGTSVIAGSAKPNSEVVISADGVEFGTVIADANGEWVLTTEHKFKSPSPKLEIATRDPIQTAATTAPKRAAQSGAEPPAPVEAKKKAPQKSESPNRTSVVEQLTEEFEQIVETARQKKKQQEKPQEKSASSVQPVKEEAPRVEETPSTNVTVADSTPAPKTPEEPKTVTRIARAETDVAIEPNNENTSNEESNTRYVAREVTKDRTPQVEQQKAPAIPIPIGFVYRKADFTEQGQKAVRLLAEYLAIKNPDSISLTGHADERGSKRLNMELSKARLRAVADELKKRGYQGQLELIARGEDEPYTGVDRSTLPKQELYALDRRVELKVFQ